MKNILSTVADFVVIILLVAAITIAISFCHKYDNCHITPSPVEDIVIDSLSTENIELVNEIELLDSLKNEEIVQVKYLDNDSTLMLFYKLIRK